MTFDVVNLNALRAHVEAGRFGAYDYENPRTLTMKDFVDAGLSNRKIKHGVKILAGALGDDAEGADDAFIKVRLEVSRASARAKEIIERAGGERDASALQSPRFARVVAAGEISARLAKARASAAEDSSIHRSRRNFARAGARGRRRVKEREGPISILQRRPKNNISSVRLRFYAPPPRSPDL